MYSLINNYHHGVFASSPSSRMGRSSPIYGDGTTTSWLPAAGRSERRKIYTEEA